MESFLSIKSTAESAIALKLLRARNLSLIIAFLYREYKSNQQITIPYQQLAQRLGDFLEEVDYAEEDEESTAERLLLDYSDKAKLYIDRWIDAHYLRNIVDETTKEPYVLLSKHTEKVFQVFELLKEKEFVSTESKFRDIFTKLRDIIENANPNKEKRLAELEKKKLAIEEEIRKIKTDGYVSTYEDYQIKSRFEEANRLANELIGDFKEVEDNFKEITRKIYENQQRQGISKGRILAEAFDALHELKDTNQGKSFYAFWQFMIDDVSQQEFQELVRQVYQVLEDREIEAPSRFLRRLKSLLHSAARKVLDKNRLLADKLTREIVAKDQPETRKVRELMSAIRQLALKRLQVSPDHDTYLELEGNPQVYLPLERKLGEKPVKNTYTTTAAQATLQLDEIEDLEKLYRADLIDKKILLRNIRELLQGRQQVSLREVIEQMGITKGLAELLAYISLVNSSDKFFVNDQERETILFDKATGKYLEVPQIIFTN